MSRKRDNPYGGNLSALDTLFGEMPAAAAELVPISQIVPSRSQPRRYFDNDELKALAASIRKHGILQPLLVRPFDNDQFLLVAGERRLRAAKEAGLETIPVVVREMDDQQAYELALLENLQREDLNPIEETDAIVSLLSMRLAKTSEDVLQAIRALRDIERGRGGNNVVTKDEQTIIEEVFVATGRFTLHSFYTHRLPLLKLPLDILEAVRTAGLAYTKAREINRITDDAKRVALLERAVVDKLSLAELKELVKAELDGNSSRDDEPNFAIVKRVKRHLSDKHIERLSKKHQREVQRLLEKLERLLTRPPDDSFEPKQAPSNE
jgi:ParB family chromosome partitioning protein